MLFSFSFVWVIDLQVDRTASIKINGKTRVRINLVCLVRLDFTCNSSYNHISTASLFRMRLIWCDPYFAVKNFSRRSFTSPFSVKLTLRPCRPGDLSQSFIVSTPHCILNFRVFFFRLFHLLLRWVSFFTTLKVNKKNHAMSFHFYNRKVFIFARNSSVRVINVMWI